MMADLAAALPLIGLILFVILILLVSVIALHDRRARFFAGGLISVIATMVLAALAGLALAGLLIALGVLFGIPGWMANLRVALP
jgi:hypothetical protein